MKPLFNQECPIQIKNSFQESPSQEAAKWQFQHNWNENKWMKWNETNEWKQIWNNKIQLFIFLGLLCFLECLPPWLWQIRTSSTAEVLLVGRDIQCIFVLRIHKYKYKLYTLVSFLFCLFHLTPNTSFTNHQALHQLASTHTKDTLIIANTHKPSLQLPDLNPYTSLKPSGLQRKGVRNIHTSCLWKYRSARIQFFNATHLLCPITARVGLMGGCCWVRS